MNLPAAVLAGIEITLNRYLRLDPETLSSLAGLSGKLIAVELRGLELTFYMAPHDGGSSPVERSTKST